MSMTCFWRSLYSEGSLHQGPLCNRATVGSQSIGIGVNLMHTPAVIPVSESQLVSLGSESPDRLHDIICTCTPI